MQVLLHFQLVTSINQALSVCRLAPVCRDNRQQEGKEEKKSDDFTTLYRELLFLCSSRHPYIPRLTRPTGYLHPLLEPGTVHGPCEKREAVNPAPTWSLSNYTPRKGFLKGYASRQGPTSCACLLKPPLAPWRRCWQRETNFAPVGGSNHTPQVWIFSTSNLPE